jgi:hypothetical protein
MSQPNKKNYIYISIAYVFLKAFSQVKGKLAFFSLLILLTVGEATRTYPLAPEASNAANLDDFLKETFVKGVVFSTEDLDGDGAGETAADNSIGGVGIGGGDSGVDDVKGAFATPMFCFRCISKSPTYHKQQINSHIMYY